jgi:hypothetical protein
VLIFFIAGLLYLLRFERVDNLGAYRIPPETGFLIPSDYEVANALLVAERRKRIGVAQGTALLRWTGPLG